MVEGVNVYHVRFLDLKIMGSKKLVEESRFSLECVCQYFKTVGKDESICGGDL